MTVPGPPDADPGTTTAVRDPLPDPGPVVDRTGGGPSERLRGLDARPGVPVAVLVVAYALSRAVAAVAGVRYDDSVIRGTPLTDMWQLLDVRLLKDDLVTSVWHLNSQPPLFNLYCGFLLKLPGGARRPVEVGCALVLGLTMVLCAYLVMVELRVPRWAALAVTLVCVVASPAYLLYENWLNYSYPTAAFETLAAWCLIRFLRTERARFGFGFFAAYAAIVLVDSTYQVEWFLLAGVIVLVALRRRWKTVLAVAAVPVTLLATWTVKDYVQVGTTTTSSWLGMNLGRSILYRAPAGQIAELQRQGRMNALASIPPFAGPRVYSPRYVRAVPNRVAAVGELYKSDGATNFNNPLYVTVSSMYLHDDLVWIRAHPHEYADDVLNAVGVWMVGTDQNFTDSINWPSVRTYARAYDRVVEWQPVQDPAPGFVVFSRGWHRPAWLSGQAMAVYALAVVGAPILAWRRRRTDPALAATLAVLWWTTLYAFATTSLIEIGENERFRSELGPVPTILAVVVVTAVVRAGWTRRQRGDAGGDSEGQVRMQVH
ncbi:MAG: hypothetical protein ABSF84_11060 [Acidimicrobiales bacterium]|jgi:hypothetical protein